MWINAYPILFKYLDDLKNDIFEPQLYNVIHPNFFFIFLFFLKRILNFKSTLYFRHTGFNDVCLIDIIVVASNHFATNISPGGNSYCWDLYRENKARIRPQEQGNYMKPIYGNHLLKKLCFFFHDIYEYHYSVHTILTITIQNVHVYLNLILKRLYRFLDHKHY